MSLLEVRDLSVNFSVEGGELEAVRRVSFDIDRGEVLAIMLSLLIFIGEAVRDAFDPRKTFR